MIPICSCDVSIFNTIIGLMESISVEEVTLRITKDGFICNTIDKAHVSMIRLMIVPAEFEGWWYERYPEEEIKLGIDLRSLKLALKPLISSVIMKYDPTHNTLLFISDKAERQVGLISTSYIKEPTAPDIKYPVTAEVSALDFNLAVRSTETVNADVIFTYDENGITISSEYMKDKARVHIHKSEMNSYESEGEGKSKFDSKYLSKIIKHIKKTVSVKMGDDFPLCIEFPIGDESNTLFMIAPRVTND